MKIAGIGIAFPSRKISSAEIEKKYGIEEGWCEKNQGIRNRYWISDEEDNTSLCSAAAENAFSNSNISANDIDMIINACNSEDSIIPDQAVLIKNRIGIKNNVPFMSIRVGCLNYIHALDIAGNLISSGKYKNILILSTIIASKGFFNKDDILSVSMLGDVSAATIVTKPLDNEDSCIQTVFAQTYSDASDASKLNGDENNETFFSKDVKEEDIFFSFDSKLMQVSGAKYNSGFIDRVVGKMSKDIDWIVPNQSTKLAVNMTKLKFGKDKILSVIEDFGNIGAVGYPVAMYYAINEGKLKRGDRILLCGIGAGLSLAGILFKY